METCPKYNNATVPFYTNLSQFEELIKWTEYISIDPVTKSLYPDAFGEHFWLPFRFDKVKYDFMTKQKQNLYGYI